MTDFTETVLGPEDVLVLVSKTELRPKDMDRMRDTLHHAGLDKRVLVVDGTTVDVKVLKDAAP